MVQSCSAYGCKNRYQKDKNISFHKFPLARPDICGKWVSAMKRRNFKPTKYSNICSQHFSRDCFKRQCNNRVLKDNAVPSLFSFSKLQAPSLEDSFSPDLDFPLSLSLSDAEETPVLPSEPDRSTADPEPVREPHLSACVSCDHNYTVEDTGQQKRRVEQLQEQTEKLRKRLKTVQQKCRRQERELERFRTMSRVQKDTVSRDQKDTVSRDQKDTVSRVQKDTVSRDQKDTVSRDQKDTVSRDQKDTVSRVQKDTDTAPGSSYAILPTEMYDVLKGIETIGAL
ncbi:THAP domain-containing protein 1 isoform X2 [Siphateles boraxobius]|uniref:THAP domain-containing protein 1 isoform X2 n=1 Tax=Siphateles boraxobius TaxID=180520 RepID=UPI004062ED78